MDLLQVELGFGNGVVNDIFFVPGYDVRGFVVSQVKFFTEPLHDSALLYIYLYIKFLG